MPEVRTKREGVAREEENSMQQLLCKLASVFSVTENRAQATNSMERGTGVSKVVVLAWDQLVSLQGHPREVRAL